MYSLTPIQPISHSSARIRDKAVIAHTDTGVKFGLKVHRKETNWISEARRVWAFTFIEPKPTEQTSYMKIRHINAALVIAFGLTISASVVAETTVAPGTKISQTKSVDPFKGLAKQRDDMNGVTWYRHASSPKHRNSNGVYLYFGKNDSGVITNLRLVAQYAAGDWLFVERAWAKADSVVVNLPQESGRFMGWERDNSGGGIWEWSDKGVTSVEEKAAVRTLANAKKVTVRYEGKKYYNDRNLSETQLKAMRDVITAYEAATGTPWN